MLENSLVDYRCLAMRKASGSQPYSCQGVADEAAVLYRCRAVDDIADESPCKDTARRQLEEVRQASGQSDEQNWRLSQISQAEKYTT